MTGHLVYALDRARVGSVWHLVRPDRPRDPLCGTGPLSRPRFKPTGSTPSGADECLLCVARRMSDVVAVEQLIGGR